MKRRLYKARTLSGAQARVRLLDKQLRWFHNELGRAWRERRQLAKLAAEGPAFHNPLDVMAAEQVRDRILAEECRMNPDGSPITAAL